MTASQMLDRIIDHRDRYNTSMVTASMALDVQAMHELDADEYRLLQDSLCFLASLEITDELARAAA